ncbi:MAG: DnaJ domain-containing protein, partial [Desulfoprunum sp.]|uniref:J domain-containing protein n=1 Tax=Desulfoprunum sp. TaxID=2020866 RepID=UPI003C757684
MRAVDRDNVTRLLQQLARDASTEGLIVFVADTSGMLQTCRAVLTLDRDGDDEAKAWLHTACAAREIAYGQLLHEARKIVQLFQADTGDGDYYAVLGLSPDATEDEVKRSYRQLSRRYHPDTAPTAGAAGTDRFIRITRAYHAIIAGEEPTIPAIPASPAVSTPPILKGRQRRRLFGPRVPLRAVVGLALLAGIVVAACLVVSEVYSRRVMLKTLHDGGVAFVPPKAQKTVREEPAALTFAEKLRRTREAEAVAAKKDERGKTIVAAASSQPTPVVISTAGRDLKPAAEQPPQGKARFLAGARNDREGASTQPTPVAPAQPTPATSTQPTPAAASQPSP